MPAPCLAAGCHARSAGGRGSPGAGSREAPEKEEAGSRREGGTEPIRAGQSRRHREGGPDALTRSRHTRAAAAACTGRPGAAMSASSSCDRLRSSARCPAAGSSSRFKPGWAGAGPPGDCAPRPPPRPAAGVRAGGAAHLLPRPSAPGQPRRDPGPLPPAPGSPRSQPAGAPSDSPQRGRGQARGCWSLGAREGACGRRTRASSAGDLTWLQQGPF